MFRFSGLFLALVASLATVGVAQRRRSRRWPRSTAATARPRSRLDAHGSTLYGTTYQGGAYGDGTVFSLPVSGGTPTVLASFNGSNGGYPCAGLTLSGNTLYGTTHRGGAYGYGTVFSIPVNGGSPTVLASFNFSNGAYPRGGLTLSGNTLYGTTEMGGNLSVNGGNGDGTVFSVPLSGGSPMVLASFNGTDGSFPAAALTLSGGTLYGTTDQGGAGNDGTVFSVPVNGGSPTVLASLSYHGSGGVAFRRPNAQRQHPVRHDPARRRVWRRHCLQPPRGRWQPHAARLVQREQRRLSLRRLDAKR